MNLPTQLNPLIDSFSSLKYLNYSEIIASFNSPIIYATLIGGAFVIFLTYASYRRHMFHLSLEGAGLGVLIGILITLTIEAGIAYKLVGFKRLASLIISPRETIINISNSQEAILGAKTENSPSCPKTIYDYLNLLSSDKLKVVKNNICKN